MLAADDGGDCLHSVGVVRLHTLQQGVGVPRVLAVDKFRFFGRIVRSRLGGGGSLRVAARLLCKGAASLNSLFVDLSGGGLLGVGVALGSVFIWTRGVLVWRLDHLLCTVYF